MAASPRDDFEDYDKPGAERSRRRRGEDDDLDSDLEGDLLEEDWLTAKKNLSDASDEELNDELLQSDEEDQNVGQGVSLNATLGEFDQQVNSTDYTEDLEDVEGGYQMDGGEYLDEYSQPNDMEMPDDQTEYSGEPAQGNIYQDEVLDIEINEPLDDEFQVDDYSTSYGEQQEPLDEQAEHQEAPEGEELEEEAQSSQLTETEEAEAEPEEEGKEEEDEDEEEDDDSESGRLRFKTERKDVTSGVVRLADAANKRRNIPETLELSEEAKADLMEFEEKERQKRQGRFGGRGGRGGDRGGFRGRGGRGGFPGFGMTDFGGGRGRMNDQRIPMMALHMGIQSPSRMPSLHHQHHHHPHQQQQHHHQGGARGPPFQEHSGGPQTLQPLIPPHLAHRGSPSHGPPVRPQMDPAPRMMSPPPSHSQQQQQHPKNIHINPHFRGPASSPAQVPLMPPAQSQPRPAVGPQRFPGAGDFQQQHMPGNFGQPPQRPPHHMETWRSQPPPAPQDREPFFIGEPGRFPGQQQHMFDHQNPGSLMNSNNHPLPGQGHMAFNQPGPGGFNQPGQGPGVQLGPFQRELPRPNLLPQGHLQGIASLTGHGGPPNTRPFIGHRQPGFLQQQGPPGPFPPQPLQFGMQVRMRGLIQPGPSLSQLQHHDLPLSHQQQQQHHRQDLSQLPPHHHHHQQHQLHPNEQRQGPMMHHHGGQGQPPFHQQQHGSPRPMHPGGLRPQNPQQRNAPIRPRMAPPASKVLPQRNSNLRELPVAPGNQSTNSVRPASAPNVKPVARATPAGVRPGLNTRAVTAGGRGRAQPTAANKAAAAPPPGPPEREVVRRDSATTQPNTAAQDPDEDEETRQYRLKIEEQKRLREEILKRKEMRRQMQAGVRKKELLERITGQNEQQQQQQQRLFPPKPPQAQQSSTSFPHNGTPQTPPTPRQNVKTRLQMTKDQQVQNPGWQVCQQGQNPGPNTNQPVQWQQQQQQQQQQGQQRRNYVTQLNPIRPGGPPSLGNMPMPGAPMAGQGSGQVQALGPKSGVKRTVMQRANSGEQAGPQVPQKVRVVKLLGGGGESEANAPIQQQPAPQPAPQLRQGPIRKVTLANPTGGQPIEGLVTHGGRGGAGNRVVVPGRGRGRGAAGVGGAGHPLRGRLMPTRQSQRGAAGSADNQPCTVSIDGLSTSTTDTQLRNLLNSIGPIKMFKMLPQQRKAIAKFQNPQHALSFQVSFNRHMIDLSHIDVSLIDG
ncbi:RNA-binding protein 33 isoform X2 [Esox lucius]|uniref:RNA-binding protein 33 isoform X2 n=1 Tax=Esox lucius TaxID=8010 RepID=UPI0014777F27|nr:RNA-binding protein 33 isoform X2 [Esox lucius]